MSTLTRRAMLRGTPAAVVAAATISLPAIASVSAGDDPAVRLWRDYRANQIPLYARIREHARAFNNWFEGGRCAGGARRGRRRPHGPAGADRAGGDGRPRDPAIDLSCINRRKAISRLQFRRQWG